MKKILLTLLTILLFTMSYANIGVSADAYGVHGQLSFREANGEVIITGCLAPGPIDLVIPKIISGCPVTKIEGVVWDSRFTQCTSITIPDSVTTIGDYAFSNCTSLASITIPDSVTTIGKRAFFNCTSLTSITIPDSVTDIDEYIFSGCNNLISATIPGSIATLEHGMFNKCKKLTNITIQDGVKVIGEAVFYGCVNLDSITIPDSVTTIGESAFKHSTKLKEIYYSGTRKEWENVVIEENNDPLKNATIHFMEGPELGDPNGDEEIDIKDVVLIRRFVTGANVDTMFKNAADVNRDGAVGVKDIIIIRRYIVGGYGVEL